MIQLNDLKNILQAKQIGNNCNISSIITDSRIATSYKESLFLALKGKHYDAHTFVKKVVKMGVSAIIVEYKFYVDIPQLIVSDTNKALEVLSYWIRRKVSTKIIALTGSSGKTSVRTMIVSILQLHGSVLSNKKNHNNRIGIALTLIRLIERKYDFAVIEIGSSNMEDIIWSSRLVQPDIALINNISIAHLEGFGSLYAIAFSKREILKNLSYFGQGIINIDAYREFSFSNASINYPIWSFSMKSSIHAHFFPTNLVNFFWRKNFVFNSPFGTCKICLSLLGMHSISNAIAASSVAILMGIPLSSISFALKKINPIPGRLFPIFLEKNKLLLDDSYNASFGSIFSAVEVLSNAPGYRVLVIGDIAELGEKKIEYHIQIGKWISFTKIDKVLSFGKWSNFISKNSHRGEHFFDKNTLVKKLKVLLIRNNKITILIKGSRVSKMEEIIFLLLKEIKKC